MLQCSFQKYTLRFVKPGGTSRGILKEKDTWIISIYDDSQKDLIAYGECGLFKGLSDDDRPNYEEKLSAVCKRLPFEKEKVLADLKDWPSIYFGVESVLKDWENGAQRILFKSDFTENHEGILINGLIWMGTKESMLEQIKNKLKEGFTCLKLKIGAIDFENELSLLRFIRNEFTAQEISLRVDANGAFSTKNALEKLKQLSEFNLHSIEQPIRAKQWQEMAALVLQSPVPIALDEELIGINILEEKKKLIETIQPSFIILKPSLVGGFAGSDEWIEIIEQHKGNWWITSALESNIGLNAIAQYTFTKKNPLPQGLGTGQLYLNNFDSPLEVIQGKLFSNKHHRWNFDNLN